MLRGEVWEARLEPVVGHEQDGTRPVLILSSDIINTAAGLVVAIPMTSRGPARKPRTWVHVAVGDGGATLASWLITEQLRCLSTERLLRRRGALSTATLAEVEDRLRIVLGL